MSPRTLACGVFRDPPAPVHGSPLLNRGHGSDLAHVLPVVE